MKLVIKFVFLLSVLVAFSNDLPVVSNDLEKELLTAFHLTDINESFQVTINGEEKTFKINSDIPLIFNNKSPYTIYFPTGSFIRLLIINDNEWMEIENSHTYAGLLLISPEGTLLKDFNIAGVRPVIDNSILHGDKKDLLLRIVLIGEIMENNDPTGRFVGAYVDVDITP